MATTLQDTYPWIQRPLICSAPMGGSAGASLAVETSRAGGLGFIGAGYDLTKLDAEFAKARQLADQHGMTQDVLPVGIGFLCFAVDIEEAISLIKKHRPAAVWLFSVNELSDFQTWTDKIHQQTKAKVWIQTGSVHDALEIARTCKPDTLVLQGSDAGGHGAIKGAGIIALLPEVADALLTGGFGDIPLLAAGGIAEARGVAASLVIGAAGAVLGTRFLASTEVKLASPYIREAILAANDGGQTTVRSQVFDLMNANNKWPSHFDGRALRNDTSKDWEAGVAMEENRQQFEDAAKQSSKGFGGSANRAHVWCGTGVGLVHETLPAAEIVRSIREATQRLLQGLDARL